MRLGTTEIILIVVLALVIFGGGKLAGVGKALGKSVKDFKNEVKDDSKPAENKPAEEKSAEKKPAEEKSAEKKPAEDKPAKGGSDGQEEA